MSTPVFRRRRIQWGPRTHSASGRSPTSRPLTLLMSLIVVGGCWYSPTHDGTRRERKSADEARVSGYQVPPPLDDGWQTGTPEDVGLKRRPLEQMTEALRRGDYPNVHALLINKDGRLVYEEYFTGTDSRWHGGHREDVSLVFDRDTLHDVRSVSKSITSALVGIALGPDAVDSLDRPLIDFFPAGHRR